MARGRKSGTLNTPVSVRRAAAAAYKNRAPGVTQKIIATRHHVGVSTLKKWIDESNETADEPEEELAFGANTVYRDKPSAPTYTWLQTATSEGEQTPTVVQERDLNNGTQLLMGVQSCRAAESREELIDREEVLERPVKLHAARYSLAAKNAMKLCAKFGGLGDPDPFLTFVTKPKGHPDFLDYLDDCSAGDDGNVVEVAVTRDAEAITREKSDKEKPQASPTVVEMETKKPTQLTIVKQAKVNDTKTKAIVNGRQEPWSATIIPAEHIDPLLRAYAISSRNPRGSKIAAITAMAGSDTYMKRKDKDQAKNPSRLKKVKK